VIFLDSVGYGVVVPVLPIYARTLDATDFQIGFLFATYAIALLLGAIPMGMLSDRYGRKPFVLFGMFAMSGAFIFYALAKSYWVLVIARTLDGLTAAATWSAGLALLGDRFEESEMGSKMGVAIGVMAVGGIAGTVLGGFLSDALGYRAPFYAIAIGCFVGGLVAVFLEEERDRQVAIVPAGRMLLNVLRNRTILIACVISMITTAGMGLLEPTLPLYLREEFSMSRTGIGLLFGFMMLLYAAASPLAGKLSDTVGRKKPIMVGLVATAAIMPFIVVFKNVAAVAVLLGLLGMTFSVFESPSVPLITDSMPKDGGGDIHYGTAFGMLNFFWSLGYALGPLLGGALMGWAGLLTALLVYSAMLLGLAVMTGVLLEEGNA
jgi:MFS transporter, DHA1 family, solute carrier family 18 (vesicular amine transporter), member 1/2